MNEQTYLHRQVHPNNIQHGEVNSLTFLSTKSNPIISTYNGDMISTEESYNHYISIGKKSVGVVSITCNECTTNMLTPINDGIGFKEHTSIFLPDNADDKEKEKIAKKLKHYANARGWQYGPIYE